MLDIPPSEPPICVRRISNSLRRTGVFLGWTERLRSADFVFCMVTREAAEIQPTMDLALNNQLDEVPASG